MFHEVFRCAGHEWRDEHCMKLLHAIPVLLLASVFPPSRKAEQRLTFTVELLGGSEPPYETLNPNPESRIPSPGIPDPGSRIPS
jgi:hypothetical protein